MNLHDALREFAAWYKLDADKLIEYADEDTTGGFHLDESLRDWPMGSIWDVEGRFLYALVRLIRPAHVVELGSAFGCSTAHISAALVKNRKGSLTCVDKAHATLHDRFTEAQLKKIEFVSADALDWLKSADLSDVTLLFEDMQHETAQVAAVWEAGVQGIADEGFIISHDAAHWVVGSDVSAGIIEVVGTRWMRLLIEPSDCGFGLWQK